MLAVAGAIDLGSGRPQPSLVGAMSAAMQTPGSETATVSEGPVALVARGGVGRAAVRRAGDVWVAVDGYVAISVEAPAPSSATGADAVLAAYRDLGADLGRVLAGNFAVVVWDAGERRLLVVRDHGGTRGLFWARRGDRVLFASELRGLLAGLARAPAVDELQLAAHIANVKLVDVSPTFRRGVERVPAEHVLSVQGAAVRCERYSDVLVQPKLRGPADWPGVMRERLGLACERAVRGVRPSLALSGGLDSNSILAVLTRLRPAGLAPVRLHAVTVRFDRFPRADEREWVDEVTARPDLDHEYVAGDGLWPLNDYPETLRYDDEPPPQFGVRGVGALMAPAKAAGCDVMLAGHGSDHLLMVSPLRMFELLRLPWRERRAELEDIERVHGARPIWKARHAAQVAVSRNAPALLRLLPVIPDLELIDQSTARRVGLLDETRRLLAVRAAEAGRLRTSREATDLAAQRLNEHIDRFARDSGVEWRLPFFDQDVMSTAMRIPADQLNQGAYLKVVLRRMLEGVAPESVVTKAQVSTHDQVMRHGLGPGGAPAIEALMRGSRLDRLGVLRDDRFWATRERMMAGGVGISAIASAISAELWLRRELDGDVPPLERPLTDAAGSNGHTPPTAFSAPAAE